MSDNLRKRVGEQVSEKLNPDSQKSSTEVASEKLTGAADKVAAAVQPNSEKSTTQKISDSVRSNNDGAQDQGSIIVSQAKDFIADVAQSVSDAVTGTTNNAKAKSEGIAKSA